MIDYTNKKPNSLKALFFTKRQNQRTYWMFLCDCGNNIEFRADKVFCEKRPIKSCGCKGNRITRKNIHDFYRKLILSRVYSKYKYGAKRRNYTFNLSEFFFNDLVSSNCYYCNHPPLSIKYLQNNKDYYIYTNGIDRKDNSIGYIESNSVSCCKICNYAKNIVPHNEFLQWINYIKKN